MIRIQTSLNIHASSQYLFNLYRDYCQWNKLFPLTIKDAKLLKNENGNLTISVSHKTAGEVINILSVVSDNEIKLEEFKPLYHAVFVNYFQPINNGTCYRVTAEITVKGFFKIVELFIKSLIKKRIRKFVLVPIRQYVQNLKFYPITYISRK
jgi:hypothetical protein